MTWHWHDKRERMCTMNPNSNRHDINCFIQNQNCFGLNKLDPRANSIPADRKGVYYKNKEESALLFSLNGDYKFSYQKSDCMDRFFEEDYDDTEWNTIDVPSMWQFRGYGECEYPNTCYPIPFAPPYVLCENPVGYYRRKFYIDEVTEHTILHFGGVDNAFFVWLNGEFVGFSKVSRSPAEFDITNKLKQGENTLAVKVFTYSDGTYLENQDMLLASGIFRDVYLLKLGHLYVFDYRVDTGYNGMDITVQLEGTPLDGDAVKITLDGQTKSFGCGEKQIKCRFDLDNPRLWNAETPELYDLTIEVMNSEKTLEIHSKKVGIMHSEVVGNKLLINGKPIYIKGVNRHEYDCKNGRAISVELIEKELKLIKENNLNAVRCAHYPNNPAFYEIASEIGLYVMDEADMETHGATVTGDQGYLAKKEEWFPAYIDRVNRMYEAQKNEVCIFIWSVGNECGRGDNMRKCVEFVRNKDKVHEVLHVQDDSANPQYTNFRKAGYIDLELIKSRGTEMPVMLVEYAHSMGNSPGFLEGYWDYIYTNEQMLGGFVWEFKNHGFYTEDENGKVFYKYGGDFHDYCNWANFNLDGLLLSDGTPKPTWYELGQVSSPIYAIFESGVKIKNTYDFLTTDGMRAQWEIREDYTAIRSGICNLPELLPHEWGELDIDYKVNPRAPGANYYLNVSFIDRNGKELSSKQFKLPFYEESKPVTYETFSCDVDQEKNKVRVIGDNFDVVFDDGMISEYAVDGKRLISKRAEINFYRAPIDNDGIAKFKRRRISQWNKIFLKHFKFMPIESNIEKSDNSVKITFSGKSCPKAKNVGFDIDIEYTILKGGNILTRIKGKPYGRLPDVLPRIGVVIETDNAFDSVTWYGRGPKQNYSDCTLASPVGLYNSSVKDMNFMFDYPQDTGNREDTKFVRLTNDKYGLCITGYDKMSFSCHNFNMNDLIAAEHRNELEYSDSNYLYIDYSVRGLGSNSCGPEPDEKHELYPHDFEFVFLISADDGNEAALERARQNLGAVSRALSDRYVCDEVVKHALEYADCDLD